MLNSRLDYLTFTVSHRPQLKTIEPQCTIAFEGTITSIDLISMIQNNFR